MNCLQCNDPITSGRADRKFCSHLCKNEFHNAKKIREHAEIKKVTLALKKNRRMLKNMVGDSHEVIIKKNVLTQMGYQFGYYTHHVKNSDGEYTFCFDFGFTIVDKNAVKIVQHSFQTHQL